MTRYIEVVVDEDGNITSSTKGFQGGQCLKEQEAIKQSLLQAGIEVTTHSTMLTAEAQACQKAVQKAKA